jgi:cyclopropane fatty-acyl-phospholipid synthase-like methyltransferase
LLLEAVRNLLGLHALPVVVSRPGVEAVLPSVPETVLAEDDDPEWPSARIAVAEALWGEGFLFPGGATETLRLAKPLGLSEAASLLLIGAGAGGSARAIAAELGVWVSGFEANHHLSELANERSVRAGFGRRAEIQAWSPRAPKFPLHYFHHGMAIEPLRGAKSEPTLAAVSLALKPGAQLVLVELVAEEPLDPADPTVAAWTRLDHRTGSVPSEFSITKVLTRLAFDVRIAEDMTRRHLMHVTDGWADAVQAMAANRPSMRQVGWILREAELWLARSRLMRAGKLRLVRWYAIGRGSGGLPPG